MEAIINYITEFGTATLILALPLIYKLYKELLKLRKENIELREKLAYLKGKYSEVVTKSHGKKNKKNE